VHYARFRFWQGDLNEEHLAHAEQLAREGKNRTTVRYLHSLRGEWHLERSEWALAAESLREAVSMARALGQTDARAETQLALAQFRLGQLGDPRREAEELASGRQPSNLALAKLRLALGDREQAKKHALSAYKWAWADGEPYVHRYELNKSRAMLEELGVEIPNLPPYDPAKDGKFPCEDEVAAAIEKLRAEQEPPMNADKTKDLSAFIRVHRRRLLLILWAFLLRDRYPAGAPSGDLRGAWRGRRRV
jgi:predicted Zn-dependent protease